MTAPDIKDDYKDDWEGAKAEIPPITSDCLEDIAQCENTGPSPIVLVLVVVLGLGL